MIRPGSPGLPGKAAGRRPTLSCSGLGRVAPGRVSAATGPAGVSGAGWGPRGTGKAGPRARFTKGKAFRPVGQLPSKMGLVSVSPSVVSNCDSMDSSPPGSSVRGILQARIPEWIVMSSSRGFSGPRN